MREKLSTQVERCLKSHSRKKTRSRVLRVLALAVVFVTVYMLIAPAVTLSNETTCGMEAHTHTDECYETRMVPSEREMACPVADSEYIVLHVHDELCYDENGELICTLPEVEGHVHTDECYREQEELTCTQTQEQGQGHTHTAQCYAYERGDLICTQAEGEGHVHDDSCYTTIGGGLICTEPESEGHTHDDSCYTVTTTEVLTCTESESNDVYDEETGELLEAGHTHDSSCYTVEETRELTCTEPESEGHTHDASCYEPEVKTLTCQESEGESHVHGDTCYEWNEELICTEPESEGHVHTDECYTHTMVLTCTKQELQPHLHDDSCYDENGELICDKPEVIEHQHTEACFVTSEGEALEKKVLICGKKEHVHTDECYQELVPELSEKYYCGLVEHTHTADCWFDSGELRCTIPEHIHTADCLNPELSIDQLPENMAGRAVWIDDTYEYETDQFHMTFHVRGYALPEQVPEDPLSPAEENEKTALPSASGAEDSGEPEPSMEPETESTPESAQEPETESTPEPEAEQEPVAEPETEPVQDIEPAAEPVGEDFTTPRGDVGEPDAEPSAPDDEPEQTVEVVFAVEEKDADAEDIAEDDADAEGADTETLLKKTITLTAEIDGVKYDLSSCSISTEIRPTQFLLNTLADAAAAAAADMPESDVLTESGEPVQIETVMSLTSMEGEVLSTASIAPAAMSNGVDNMDGAVDEGEDMVVQADLNDNRFELTLTSQANPTYTVEYYAYLSTVDSRDGAGKDEKKLEVIDTSGTGLPLNGTGTASPTGKLKNMYVDDSNKVVMRSDVQPVYRTHKYKYASAPGLKYVNIIGNQVTPENASDNLLPNYELKEIWVQQGDNPQTVTGEIISTVTNGDAVTEKVRNADGTEREVTWKKITVTPDVRLTNLAQTAEKNKDCVLVEDNAVLRLVYKTTDGNYQNDTAFYDYDITNGKDGDRWKIGKAGINDYEAGNGAHYAFGNNIGTGYATESWGGNELNKSNGSSFSGCTFGIVRGINADGDVIFSDGIVGPELFKKENVDKKKTVYDGALAFNRQGDTYTLKTASSGSGGSVGNLEVFNPRPNWNNTRTLWSNYFWPLDSAEGKDPKFGEPIDEHAKEKYTGVDGNGKVQTGWMYASDDGKDHNHYFGMKFAVEFNLSRDYVGPLEYWFFGDDDMWVFLTDEETGATRLICDIGGVHGSVGEYVDLWDYIDPWPNKDGTTSEARELGDIVDVTAGKGEGNSDKRKYRLDFFYTERGASGSTCWMQFTLPTLAGVDLEDTIKTRVDEDHGALWIKKEVDSQIEEDRGKDFKFRLELFDTDENGNPLINTMPVLDTNGNQVLDENGEPMVLEEPVKVDGAYVAYKITGIQTGPYIGSSGEGVVKNGEEFTLRDGEELVITNLPKGARYRITEVLDEKEQEDFKTTVDTTVEYLEKYPGYPKEPTITAPVENEIAGGRIEGATQTKVHYLNESTVEVKPPEPEGNLGALWLAKKVENVSSNTTFRFYITLDFNGVAPEIIDGSEDFKQEGYFNAKIWDSTDNGQADREQKLPLTDNKVTLTVGLQDGWKLAILNLPQGTAYTVTEDDGVFSNYNVHYVKSYEVAEPEDTGTENGTQDDTTANDTGNNEPEKPELPQEEQIPGQEAKGIVDAGITDKLECVNSAKYVFPETGASIGNSAIMYTLAGTLLVLAVCCLWYRKRNCKGGAAN